MRKLCFLLASVCLCVFQLSAQFGGSHMRDTNAAFYQTEEARITGDQILAYQRVTGGWPKNTDMEARLTPQAMARVLADKGRRDDSTIDNGATTSQMTFLARLYQATSDTAYAGGFRRGVAYLLDGQYENGGWPQFWPDMSGYQYNITFNDDAMVNTLQLFSDMIQGKDPYGGSLIDDATRQRLQRAYDRGIDCILNTQIVVRGKPTIWCQQYDRETLKPAGARAYELPSFCSQESAAIVRLLMNVPDPDARIVKAVHGAMQWFDTYKLTGVRVERTVINGERTAHLAESPGAPALWARFYDLKYNEPYVCDRDGLPRRRLEEIGRERRSGYSWYGTRPAALYALYDAWAERYDKRHKLKISLDTPGANEKGTIDMFRQHRMNPADFDVTVSPGGSIQAAIEKAPADNAAPFKILVRKGTYHQRVVIDRPHIVLIGEDRAETVLVIDDSDIAPVREGAAVDGTVLTLTAAGNDAVISGFTIDNNVSNHWTPTEQSYQVPHRMAVRGSADRTILINCNIHSNGNDALALWAAHGDGMYYHADLRIDCPGVDFICPRGWCYATRCQFIGGGRAMLWHDGRGDRTKKFVITNSDFDATEPTLLGRYHHDAQFFLLHNRFSANILNRDIQYAYSDRVLDACPWGQRVYYHNCVREGGVTGWMRNNIAEAEEAVESWAMTAAWTFGGRWDPEGVLQGLWDIIAY